MILPTYNISQKARIDIFGLSLQTLEAAKAAAYPQTETTTNPTMTGEQVKDIDKKKSELLQYEQTLFFFVFVSIYFSSRNLSLAMILVLFSYSKNSKFVVLFLYSKNWNFHEVI